MFRLESMGRPDTIKRILLIEGSVFFLVAILLLITSCSTGNSSILIELAGISTNLIVVARFGVYLMVASIVILVSAHRPAKITITLLTFVTVLNIFMGIVVFRSSVDGFRFIEDGLHDAQGRYDWDHRITEAWDTIQTDMKCCGTLSYMDWQMYRPKGHKLDGILPGSCCVHELETSHYCKRGMEIWEEGCADRLEIRMIVMCVTILFFILFSLASSIVLSTVLKSKEGKLSNNIN
uniref:Tetraspanin-6 n=1 Tax=Aceria tosichella TaxID=561515 RepID=A0A6G1SPP1_9ACAR